MLQWFKYIMAVIWLFLIVVTAVNLYYRLQVGTIQSKILKEYTLMSEVPGLFQTVRDSIQQKINRLDKKRVEMDKTFPFQDKALNWLLLRISIVFMTIVTFVYVWFYYKTKAKE